MPLIVGVMQDVEVVTGLTVSAAAVLVEWSSGRVLVGCF
jgi:hypothetical protein